MKTDLFNTLLTHTADLIDGAELRLVFFEGSGVGAILLAWVAVTALRRHMLVREKLSAILKAWRRVPVKPAPKN